MTCIVFLIVAIAVLVAAAFGLSSAGGVSTLPLGLALAAGAWLAVLLKMP